MPVEIIQLALERERGGGGGGYTTHQVLHKLKKDCWLFSFVLLQHSSTLHLGRREEGGRTL